MAADPLADPAPLIRRVYAYVAYRVGDGPEAEDITSETFERALRYREKYDSHKGTPAAWLLGIAIGLILAVGLIGWLRHLSFAGGLITLLAMTAVYFVIWVAVSARLPHAGVPARALMPGALLLAVGVQGLQLFTAYYLAGRAQRAASLYGTIGAALALLLWLFIIARLMVGGAILNAELASAHESEDEQA